MDDEDMTFLMMLFMMYIQNLQRTRIIRRRMLLLLLLQRRQIPNRKRFTRGPCCRLQFNNPHINAILQGDVMKTKTHLRVTPAAFLCLVSKLSPKRHGWSREFEAMVFLYWLACGASICPVAKSLCLPRSTVFRVSTTILSEVISLIPQVIKLPTTAHLDTIGHGFASLVNSKAYERCVGAIGGCQIQVVGLNETHQPYVNRRLFYPINMHGICDFRGMFLDIFTGFPGSDHDVKRLQPNQTFRRGEYPPEGYFIIGDIGYPCRVTPFTLVTPYQECVEMTPSEQLFNQNHRRARIIAEHSFEMMKTRWQSLFTKVLDMKMEKAVKVISACVLMHNICMSVGDIIPIDENNARPVSVLTQTDEVDACEFRDRLCEFQEIERAEIDMQQFD